MAVGRHEQSPQIKRETQSHVSSVPKKDLQATAVPLSSDTIVANGPRVPIENIYIHPEEMQGFLEKYPYLKMKKLSNGITMIGMPLGVPGAVGASVQFTYANGGAFRSPDTQASHFVEHIAALGYRKQAVDSLANVSAETSSRHVSFDISGVANTEVRDIGIWPVLQDVRDALEDPIEHITRQRGRRGADRLIANERQAILSELQSDKTDPDRQVGRLLAQILFGSNNPLNAIHADTGESVHAITKKDLREHAKAILNPADLVITVVSHGEQCDKLFAEVEKLFSTLKPRPVSASEVFPLQEADTISQVLKQGEILDADTELKEKKVDLILAWPFKRLPLSREDYALQLFVTLFNDKVFDYIREKEGLAYSTGATIIDNAGKQAFVLIDAGIRRPEVGGYDAWELIEGGLIEKIKSEVLHGEGLHDAALTEFLEKQRRLRRAMNITRQEVYDAVVTGLMSYGVIIDPIKSRATEDSVTVSDLKKIRDKMFRTEPFIAVIGDTSEKQTVEVDKDLWEQMVAMVGLLENGDGQEIQAAI